MMLLDASDYPLGMHLFRDASSLLLATLVHEIKFRPSMILPIHDLIYSLHATNAGDFGYQPTYDVPCIRDGIRGIGCGLDNLHCPCDTDGQEAMTLVLISCLAGRTPVNMPRARDAVSSACAHAAKRKGLTTGLLSTFSVPRTVEVAVEQHVSARNASVSQQDQLGDTVPTKSGMSSGAITGIAVAVVAAVLLVLALVYLGRKKRRTIFEEAGYGGGTATELTGKRSPMHGTGTERTISREAPSSAY
ncbi:uncharacterized protein CLUP02_05150 [Colletotrichum lupini]|uniref:Extracellular membrane protein CFEM domain-containing protein n=1 Tax=Colletotrichum lupini TaxID=145971 RepID=A0A9Q8WEI1_9PEZI|nr:uncharacterized protein CLUP02_05150 [Colletotrichum lupini]KAK1707056.1 hypothetical protein BDP67DRAFT_162122 [Colletotrichum lupini]UQC79670.1 hypothetical protein CLUP02_05150 [Colletotrichum lupini]